LRLHVLDSLLLPFTFAPRLIHLAAHLLDLFLPRLNLLLLLHHHGILDLDALFELLFLFPHFFKDLGGRLDLGLAVKQFVLHLLSFGALIRPCLLHCLELGTYLIEKVLLLLEK
jgi:hypothetical protein